MVKSPSAVFINIDKYGEILQTEGGSYWENTVGYARGGQG